jgi:hypothetical protein
VGATSVLLVKMAFILTTEFVKLVADAVLNVAVLKFAENSIKVYHILILIKDANACLDTNLTPLQIFVSQTVVNYTMLAVKAVLIPNARIVIQVIIY